MSTFGYTVGGAYNPSNMFLFDVSSVIPTSDNAKLFYQDANSTSDVAILEDVSTGDAYGFTIDPNNQSSPYVTQHNAGFFADFSDNTAGVVLNGGDFADLLVGSKSDDTLAGGLGDDTLAPTKGDDSILGGGGVDTVSYFNAAQGVTVNLALQGSAQTTGIGDENLSAILNLTGSSHNDILTGDGAGNVLTGGAGVDRLTGSGGADTLVSAGDGDTLNGGPVGDTYRFTALSQHRPATIVNLNGDTIDFAAVDADTTTAGDQAFRLVAYFDGDPGEILLKHDKVKDRDVILFDTDGDGHANYKITVVSGNDFSHIVF